MMMAHPRLAAESDSMYSSSSCSRRSYSSSYISSLQLQIETLAQERDIVISSQDVMTKSLVQAQAQIETLVQAVQGLTKKTSSVSTQDDHEATTNTRPTADEQKEVDPQPEILHQIQQQQELAHLLHQQLQQQQQQQQQLHLQKHGRPKRLKKKDKNRRQRRRDSRRRHQRQQEHQKIIAEGSDGDVDVSSVTHCSSIKGNQPRGLVYYPSTPTADNIRKSGGMFYIPNPLMSRSKDKILPPLDEENQSLPSANLEHLWVHHPMGRKNTDVNDIVIVGKPLLKLYKDPETGQNVYYNIKKRREERSHNDDSSNDENFKLKRKEHRFRHDRKNSGASGINTNKRKSKKRGSKWVVHHNKNGLEYYFNRINGECQWPTPENEELEEMTIYDEKALANHRVKRYRVTFDDDDSSTDISHWIPDGNIDSANENKQSCSWAIYKSANGDDYYYNVITGESQWQIPQEILSEKVKRQSSERYRNLISLLMEEHFPNRAGTLNKSLDDFEGREHELYNAVKWEAEREKKFKHSEDTKEETKSEESSVTHVEKNSMQDDDKSIVSWVTYQDQDGKNYYHHPSSGVTQWNKGKPIESKLVVNSVPGDDEKTIASWITYEDQGGKKYFHHPSTGETQWHKNRKKQHDLHESQVEKATEDDDSTWVSFLDPNGKRYYYNPSTGVTQWHKKKKEVHTDRKVQSHAHEDKAEAENDEVGEERSATTNEGSCVSTSEKVGKETDLDGNETEVDEDEANVVGHGADAAEVEADIVGHRADVAEDESNMAEDESYVAEDESYVAEDEIDVAANQADVAVNEVPTDENKIPIAEDEIKVVEIPIAEDEIKVVEESAIIEVENIDVCEAKTDEDKEGMRNNLTEQGNACIEVKANNDLKDCVKNDFHGDFAEEVGMEHSIEDQKKIEVKSKEESEGLNEGSRDKKELEQNSCLRNERVEEELKGTENGETDTQKKVVMEGVAQKKSSEKNLPPPMMEIMIEEMADQRISVLGMDLDGIRLDTLTQEEKDESLEQVKKELCRLEERILEYEENPETDLLTDMQMAASIRQSLDSVQLKIAEGAAKDMEMIQKEKNDEVATESEVYGELELEEKQTKEQDHEHQQEQISVHSRDMNAKEKNVASVDEQILLTETHNKSSKNTQEKNPEVAEPNHASSPECTESGSAVLLEDDKHSSLKDPSVADESSSARNHTTLSKSDCSTGTQFSSPSNGNAADSLSKVSICDGKEKEVEAQHSADGQSQEIKVKVNTSDNAPRQEIADQIEDSGLENEPCNTVEGDVMQNELSSTIDSVPSHRDESSSHCSEQFIETEVMKSFSMKDAEETQSLKDRNSSHSRSDLSHSRGSASHDDHNSFRSEEIVKEDSSHAIETKEINSIVEGTNTHALESLSTRSAEELPPPTSCDSSHAEGGSAKEADCLQSTGSVSNNNCDSSLSKNKLKEDFLEKVAEKELEQTMEEIMKDELEQVSKNVAGESPFSKDHESIHSNNDRETLQSAVSVSHSDGGDNMSKDSIQNRDQSNMETEFKEDLEEDMDSDEESTRSDLSSQLVDPTNRHGLPASVLALLSDDNIGVEDKDKQEVESMNSEDESVSHIDRDSLHSFSTHGELKDIVPPGDRDCSKKNAGEDLSQVSRESMDRDYDPLHSIENVVEDSPEVLDEKHEQIVETKNEKKIDFQTECKVGYSLQSKDNIVEDKHDLIAETKNERNLDSENEAKVEELPCEEKEDGLKSQALNEASTKKTVVPLLERRKEFSDFEKKQISEAEDPYEWAYEVWRCRGLMNKKGSKNPQKEVSVTRPFAVDVDDQPLTVRQRKALLEGDTIGHLKKPLIHDSDSSKHSSAQISPRDGETNQKVPVVKDGLSWINTVQPASKKKSDLDSSSSFSPEKGAELSHAVKVEESSDKEDIQTSAAELPSKNSDHDYVSSPPQDQNDLHQADWMMKAQSSLRKIETNQDEIRDEAPVTTEKDLGEMEGSEKHHLPELSVVSDDSLSVSEKGDVEVALAVKDFKNKENTGATVEDSATQNAAEASPPEEHRQQNELDWIKDARSVLKKREVKLDERRDEVPQNDDLAWVKEAHASFIQKHSSRTLSNL